MNALLWIDVETTGLDPATDVVLAVGMVLTDASVSKTVESPLLVIFHHDPDALTMSDYVRDMHSNNGLLNMCARSGVTESEGSALIHGYLGFCCQAKSPMDQRPYVAGSTVSFDRSFMLHKWPWYRDHVHYRSLDVSSLRTEISLMRPELLQDAPKKCDIHLPLADIEDSQNLLRFLRSKMWGVK